MFFSQHFLRLQNLWVHRADHVQGLSCRLDLLGTPRSGTSKEWRLWEAKARAERAVRWFIQRTLWQDGLARRWTHLCWRIRDAKWAVLYRLHPAHRYHLLNTGLAVGYHDVREQLLHASFHALAGFYERQRVGHVDWQADERHKTVWAEITALHDWWTQVRPRREASLHPVPREGVLEESFAVFDEDYQDRPEVREWRRVVGLNHAIEKSWEQEDEDMLIRLAKVRTFLWD